MVQHPKYLWTSAHPELTVQLDNSQVELDTLHGAQLNGTVVLTCREPIRLMSVILQLQGKAKVSWNELGQQCKQDHVLFKHQEVLSTASFAKNQQWHFSVSLPAHLPSTLEGHGHANVRYRLKVIGERPAFLRNMVAKQDVHVVSRTRPQPEMLETVSLTNVAHNLAYAIQLPGTIYAPGSVLSAAFCLEPQQASITVRSVSCVLTSHTTLLTRRRTHRIKETVAYFRDDHFVRPMVQAPWMKTEELTIPETAADIDCAILKRRYKLKFSFSVIQPDGRLAVTHTTMPIHISHTDMSTSEPPGDCLPTYEAARLDILCDSSLWTSACPLSDLHSSLTLPTYESTVSGQSS